MATITETKLTSPKKVRFNDKLHPVKQLFYSNEANKNKQKQY